MRLSRRRALPKPRHQIEALCGGGQAKRPVIPYIAKRLAMLVVVLLASTVVVFLLLHLAPGNPAVLLNGGHPPTPATLKYFDRLYGLNRPLPVQYLIWLRHLLSGNLGVSAVSRTSVVSVIGPRIGLTLLLTAYALVVMIVIGIPLGIFSGVFRNGPIDFFATWARWRSARSRTM